MRFDLDLAVRYHGSMRKKTALWMSAFIILFVANLTVTIGYMNKVRRVQDASKILDEISELSYDPYQNTGSQEIVEDTQVKDSVQFADGRVANLKRFFRKYNSPLYDQAEHIVKVSDTYKMDYRLVPAIAMQESGLCRVIPNGSHNCWGWGIYGNTVTRFNSYEEAIETVSKGLRVNYLDKGYVTPTQIMEKYTPSSQGSWARGVNFVLESLQ